MDNERFMPTWLNFFLALWMLVHKTRTCPQLEMAITERKKKHFINQMHKFNHVSQWTCGRENNRRDTQRCPILIFCCKLHAFFLAATDLINNLLQVKVRKRYSVDKTLSHPWLQVRNQSSNNYFKKCWRLKR